MNQSQMYRNEEYFWTPEEKSRFDLKPQLPATCLGPRCWLSDHSVTNADGETIEGYRRTARLQDGSRVYGGCRHYLPAGVYVDKVCFLLYAMSVALLSVAFYCMLSDVGRAVL